MARRFSRKSKDLLKALRRLGYTLHRGRGDHTKVLFIAPCADGSDFKFSFPVDRGEIPEGTFRAMLNQAGGLNEEQLLGALEGTFTETDYRALIASRTRTELLRLTMGRRFRS
ncbi:MAG TPA: type II toxin-antitoxin system HicA family toxin [Anaerolineae bacterium]|nr:type II toxin-antitoxin system HicA family toxin [Anaerolineae bacterium]